MFANRLIAAVWDVLGTTGVPVSTDSDPQYAALHARYSELYNRTLDRLEEQGLLDLAEDVRELVAALDEMEDVSWRHVYAKGLMDGIWAAVKVRKSSPASRVG